MKIITHIQPRQSGKTTTLVSRYLEDLNNSAILTFSQRSKKDIRERFSLTSNRHLYSASDLLNGRLLATRFRSIFIDDYLQFTQEAKKRLNEYIETVHPEVVVSYTSSTESTPLWAYLLIREIREIPGVPLSNMIQKMKKEGSFGLEQLKELSYSLLTHPQSKIILHTEEAPLTNYGIDGIFFEL